MLFKLLKKEKSLKNDIENIYNIRNEIKKKMK